MVNGHGRQLTLQYSHNKCHMKSHMKNPQNDKEGNW